MGSRPIYLAAVRLCVCVWGGGGALEPPAHYFSFGRWE